MRRLGVQGLIFFVLGEPPILRDAISRLSYPLFQSRLLRGHTLLASPPELSIRTRCLVPSCECGSRFCRRWQVPQLLCRLHLFSKILHRSFRNQSGILIRYQRRRFALRAVIGCRASYTDLLSAAARCRDSTRIPTYERAQIVHLPQKLCRNSGYILRAREGLGAIRLSSYSVCGAHVTLYRDIISIRLVLNCAASPMRSVICNRD
ncbi:unnamed protein product [Trichogramma brassicae]|uniref:Uncharacterized protein n=1 Tax=Trichogramma brassicae TaxID=86971 RepID=A0A6H5IEK8_9HYME|nr:unnamed protein product [Trichogramma brassicae]